MHHSQKVCPVEVQKILDPFYRPEGAVRCDTSPRFRAILEFLLQFPPEARLEEPKVESLCVTADGWTLLNGLLAGRVSVLQRELREWGYVCELENGYMVESFQAMINTNIGMQAGAERITI